MTTATHPLKQNKKKYWLNCKKKKKTNSANLQIS